LISSTGEHVKKILKQVSLRNDYTVYEEGEAYSVAGENQRGQRYECRVVPEAVDYLCDRTRGRNITSERAGGVIAPVAERFTLPYIYGNRLRYSGQYVLLGGGGARTGYSDQRG
jgi:hypothetical protein